MDVGQLLDGRRVCVCGGSGGVGKTTTSAAVALGMAARGLRVAVVTIDPARRLANALGLDELGNEPRRVDGDHLAAAGGQIDGELWAMMLDPKRTFDELIDRIAPDARRAEEIKANRVYREISGAVSGSQEFTAVAKLYELARDGNFDLLVLDTPPSRNAQDFLDAPGRLTSFLDGSAIRTLIRPTGLGMRVLGRGASPLIGGLRRVTGLDLLDDLQTFFGLLGSMTEEFSRRAAQVDAMLHADSTAFLLVTTATEPGVDEALWFQRSLREGGLSLAGVVANRVHPDRLAHGRGGGSGDGRGAGEIDVVSELGAALPRHLSRRVAAAFADDDRLARRDARQLARLSRELRADEDEGAEDGGGGGGGEGGGGGGGGAPPIIEVPLLDGDVHDIAGLERVRAFLFATPAQRARLMADLIG
jgi:anion-transporting  ArsA/GET3 family ATPase